MAQTEVKEILQRPGGPGYLEQQRAMSEKPKLTTNLSLHHQFIIETTSVDASVYSELFRDTALDINWLWLTVQPYTVNACPVLAPVVYDSNNGKVDEADSIIDTF